MRNMITTGRLLIATLTLVVAFGATHVDPSIAGAQTTPLCPATIAPVKGGFGDAATLGLDDGVRRGAPAFAPGQLIVVLRPGRTAKDLQCVADELRAVIIDGGAGRKGLGGIPNAIVLQLQPGVSVERTASLLLQTRYQGLIALVQPNTVGELVRAAPDETVDDPLFPVQWGLSNSGQVPQEMEPFPVPFQASDLLANPFTSAKESLRYSIRLRQAWTLLARRALPSVTPIRVAIVDNSLAAHSDLDANVSTTGNARYSGASGAIRIELLKKAGTANLDILDEWDQRQQLCQLKWNVDDPAKRIEGTWVAKMIASQTNHLCLPSKVPTTWRVTIRNAYAGSAIFEYGGQMTGPIDLSPLWDPRVNPDTATNAIQTELLAIVPGGRANSRIVAVAARSNAGPVGDAMDRTRELRIVLYGNAGKLAMRTDGLKFRPDTFVSQPTSTSATYQTAIGVMHGQGGTFRIQYSITTIPDDGLPGAEESTDTVETGDLAPGATGRDVTAQLNAALATSPARDFISSFTAGRVSADFPRIYNVSANRAVRPGVALVREGFSVTASAVQSAPPATADVVEIKARGTVTPLPDGVTSIDIGGLATVKAITSSSPDVTIGLRASPDAVEVMPAANRWPGGLTPDADHGQFIAGVIGATANNNLGMTGVIGDQSRTKTRISINGVVSALNDAGLLTMLEYAESDLRAHVVNFSIGTNVMSGDDLFDRAASSSNRNRVLRGEDPLPTRALNLQMGEVGSSSRTLFVVAAGNEGSDLRRPVASIRAQKKRAGDRAVEQLLVRNPQATDAEQTTARAQAEARDRAVGLYPCRPKGMGVAQRPVGIASRTSAKGGTLSMLQMPDGTFDRGNILCVASADWNGNLLDYSNWGPGIVDVAAPGDNIIGTALNDGYKSDGGTSFAAPMVAGVAAMVYSVLPDAEPWLVKCAVLSSATSKPLRQPDPKKAPFTYLTMFDGDKGWHIPYPKDSPLTVNGMVQASEAISAALYLDGRVRRAQSTGSWPTCVQKRGFFGGWKNTPVLG